jgi:D-alanyl-lipoteichoic acid acyltransferase DltB (MBOAT superfamily)
MLFNSLDFAIFLPIVFALYWAVGKKNIRLQNIIILCASYVFYGWWDWRFLSLILFSTLVDYAVGRGLEKVSAAGKRKTLLWTSITVNLGLLGFFKYFNFFLDNLEGAFTLFGSAIQLNSLNIILPVGISFYTFQTLSYTIDVYHKKLQPTRDFISFAAYVSFFPQLVAGPIERAKNLLPQFSSKRDFEYKTAVLGFRQILWGFFKKLVIADNCAIIVNHIFANSSDLNGSTLFIGAIFFAFQIYGDFSGYSDIAIGTARLFGFHLMQNFAHPYFSRDIAEFWRRWHISLSTWFRDYLYIPLGGSRGGTSMKIRNTFIIFIVSGFWHGANWTFIVWGALNALYFLPLLLTNKNRRYTHEIAPNRKLPTWVELRSMVATFMITVLAWVFFRANNLTHAFEYLAEIFSVSFFQMPLFQDGRFAAFCLVLILFFIVIEWMGRNSRFAIESFVNRWKKVYRIGFYYSLIGIIIYFGNFTENEFIYFQF